MARATLKVRAPGETAREVAFDNATSIGRERDNAVCLRAEDVAPYHAVIERVGDAFWLSDLGSGEPTTVGGRRVGGERQLRDGDTIVVGTATLEFRCSRATTTAAPSPPSAAAPSPAGPSRTTIVAGVAVGAVVVAALLAGAIYLTRPTASAADAPRAAGVAPGGELSGPTVVRLDNAGPDVARVTYRIDGAEVARATRPPFALTIDPASLAATNPSLGPGAHVLTATLEDGEGATISELAPMQISFADTSAAVARPAPAAVAPVSSAPAASSGAVDVGQLATRFATQVSQKSGYTVSPAFAERVAWYANAYRDAPADGAAPYRVQINRAFGAQGVAPLVGSVAAAGASSFRPTGGATPDLWRLPPSVASVYAHGESESGPQRDAEVAAAYLKDLLNQFEPDEFMYALACYGEPLSAAGDLRAAVESGSTPADRLDFWSQVERGAVSRERADRVAKFLAAGVVGENPEAFGLPPRRLSSLY